ncbi:hypothetical protein [Streptomyces sp. CB02261]|uniref:hypothetical protein n=1 Tax=Streptomyces sp. CB02261 TaxID=1703940 RepID=UPI000939B74B|nr:hypothetical protein [Streptomyces sp. CB02261]
MVSQRLVVRRASWRGETHQQSQTLHREPTGVAVVIGHAARIATALATGDVDMEDGQSQVLAALSIAETLDAASWSA